jgi:spermidine/putrescine transport system permease protein
LLPPLFWLTALYFVPLAILLGYSFFKHENFEVIRTISLNNFIEIVTSSAYRATIGRTLFTAALVTVISAAISLPLAYFIARFARRYRALLTVLVILPLWSSYLVRAFAWKIILGTGGVLNAILLALGIIDQPSPIFLYNSFAVTLTFVHVWLPFMILPLITAFERLPQELLEAGADLGARPAVVFGRVTLPLVMPGVISGSLSVFSLTMGDFITPSLVGGNSGIQIGNLVASQFGVADNWPLGAAFALLVLLVVFAGIALIARRGGLDAL